MYLLELHLSPSTPQLTASSYGALPSHGIPRGPGVSLACKQSQPPLPRNARLANQRTRTPQCHNNVSKKSQHAQPFPFHQHEYVPSFPIASSLRPIRTRRCTYHFPAELPHGYTQHGECDTTCTDLFQIKISIAGPQ